MQIVEAMNALRQRRMSTGRVYPLFKTISWAYPLTWTLSSVLLLIVLLKLNWGSGSGRKAAE